MKTYYGHGFFKHGWADMHRIFIDTNSFQMLYDRVRDKKIGFNNYMNNFLNNNLPKNSTKISHSTSFYYKMTYSYDDSIYDTIICGVNLMTGKPGRPFTELVCINSHSEMCCLLEEYKIDE